MESSAAGILFQIFVIFAAAKVFGLVGERLGVSGVVAELAAGILIGPYVLAWVAIADWTRALAALGAVVLLFDVGLGQHLTRLIKVGGTAFVVATLGVIVPFFLGYALLAAMNYSQTEAVFLGAAMVATSVGITARVLQDLGQLETVVATIILGAAVIDDILAMIVLAIVSSLSEGIDYVKIGAIAAIAVSFTLFTVLVGRRVMRRVTPRAQKLAGRDDFYFPLALGICLALAVAAEEIGIAAIVGAFLAGLVFSEEEFTPALQSRVDSLYEFLVPFFFVTLGMQMDIRVLARGEILLLAALVTALAVLGKLIGCGAGAWKLGPRAAAQIGVGMVPRGEVGLIVASIGLGLQAVSQEVYSVVVFMVLATTLLAPFALKRVFALRSG